MRPKWWHFKRYFLEDKIQRAQQPSCPGSGRQACSNAKIQRRELEGIFSMDSNHHNQHRWALSRSTLRPTLCSALQRSAAMAPVREPRAFSKRNNPPHEDHAPTSTQHWHQRQVAFGHARCGPGASMLRQRQPWGSWYHTAREREFPRLGDAHQGRGHSLPLLGQRAEVRALRRGQHPLRGPQPDPDWAARSEDPCHASGQALDCPGATRQHQLPEGGGWGRDRAGPSRCACCRCCCCYCPRPSTLHRLEGGGVCVPGTGQPWLLGGTCCHDSLTTAQPASPARCARSPPGGTARATWKT